jgi:adenosylhomocysteine nucleosidase
LERAALWHKINSNMATSNDGNGPLGDLARQPVDLLVCFAVKEEAKFFLPHRMRPAWRKKPSKPRAKAKSAIPRPMNQVDICQVWMTGIGRANAARSIRQAIALVQPERVISAGFAGGLNPALKFGAIVYEQDFDAGFAPELEDLGAVPARFYCHRRVAITAQEKRQLWQSSGADAVEMESSVIRTICREHHIPSATIRVISDDASQDLPLDFNALMTSEDRINYLKLIWAVLSRPSRIPKLVEFQRHTVVAARRLGSVLEELLRAERC